MDKLLRWISSLPTTQFRVLCTMVVFFGLMAVYLAINAKLAWRCAIAVPIPATCPAWTPDWTMLGFVGAMAGIDVLQYFGKRATDIGYVSAKTGNPNPTGNTAENKVVPA